MIVPPQLGNPAQAKYAELVPVPYTQVMAGDAPTGQKSAPLALLMCPHVSKVLPLPAPTRLIALLILTCEPLVASPQFPARKNTVSPAAAAFTAFWMHAAFHGLALVPEPVHPPVPTPAAASRLVPDTVTVAEATAPPQLTE
jgi:hypothetical protein